MLGEVRAGWIVLAAAVAAAPGCGRSSAAQSAGSKTDRAETDRAETDRAETDRAETDRAETDRAETDRTSGQGAARAPAGMSRAAYDRWRRPDLLLAALALEPGEVVADVGAGRGYLTRRLAAAIGPRGRVVATEIDPDALAALARLVPAPGEAPIEVRRVASGDPGLESGRYDLVLLAQV